MTGQKFTITDAGWRDNRSVAYFCYTLKTNEKTFELEETLQFPAEIPESDESEKLLRALHIALAISYYKSYLPPVIEHPYAMDDVEANFWNTVYLHGLGEFLYKNSLSGSLLAKFSAQDGKRVHQNSSISWSDEVVLGIGGGKDSIVAGEILKEAGIPVSGFVLATGEILGQTQAVANVMGVKLAAVKRKLDPKILEINTLEGAYNGHIPISLIFGLVGTMLAAANQNRYVLVANEASASIPQATWEGKNINHQWSKSLEFERTLQDYLHNFVSKEMFYFSAVRPLTSVAIAKLFAQYPQYFEVFTSDNSLFKIEQSAREHPRWSKQSSKSLSSYILLAPWMSDEDLLRIFGENYLNIPDLTPMISKLLGENGQSVLDCVGTPEELKASMSEIVRQSRFSDSALVNYTVDKQLLRSGGNLDQFMTLQDHNIPTGIAPKIIPIMENHL